MRDERHAPIHQPLARAQQRVGAVEQARRQRVHELARHAVVVRHGDQARRPGGARLRRARCRYTDVARQQPRDGLVHRADVLRSGGGEDRGRLDHLAQVQAHAFVGALHRSAVFADEAAQQVVQRLGERQRWVVEAGELRGDAVDRHQQHRAVQPVLVAEVVVDRGRVQPRRFADLAGRGLGIALLGKDTAGLCQKTSARTLTSVSRGLGRVPGRQRSVHARPRS